MGIKITVVGLGYVGLPLAIEFAKKYPTVGFDTNKSRIDELVNGHDSTLEIEDKVLNDVIVPDSIFIDNNSKGLFCTSDLVSIESSNFYVITVPTPTDKHKRPVLTPLIKASENIGKVLNKGDYVIYESTVYPGVTEDICVPILEEVSGLKFNKDFYVGYSPERINPGDKERTLTKILKVTSGSTPEAALVIDNLYKSVITVGTHLAPTIKVAEASKVIENSQRDINIAFVNELAKIFNKLDIDTAAVLEAAGTKWNFLPFKPGLVGGHCIGVDPYYLAQKAQESGYYPEIILSGRRINDSMGSFIASDIVKKMIKRDISVKESKALILGFTFKENCPDVRNSRVIDVYNDLIDYGLKIDVYDSHAKVDDVLNDYNLILSSKEHVLSQKYSVIILAVCHSDCLKLDISELCLPQSMVYDIKGFLPKSVVDEKL